MRPFVCIIRQFKSADTRQEFLPDDGYVLPCEVLPGDLVVLQPDVPGAAGLGLWLRRHVGDREQLELVVVVFLFAGLPVEQERNATGDTEVDHPAVPAVLVEKPGRLERLGQAVLAFDEYGVEAVEPGRAAGRLLRR